MTPVSDRTSFDSHGLGVWKQCFNSVVLGSVDDQCAVKILLSLTLLLQQVIATVALHDKLSASRALHSLLRAAV